MKSPKEFNKIWAKIMAKAWSDPAFKDRLMKDPAGVLHEYGCEVPSEVKVHIDENTERSIYLTLLQKPAGELTEEELENIAAAGEYKCMPC